MNLEATNLVVALKSLAPQHQKRYNIIMNTDNEASQKVLSSGTGRDSILIKCAPEIWRYAADTSPTIDMVHKPGKDLILADALSCRISDQAARGRAEQLCKEKGLTKIWVNFLITFTEGI